MKAQHYQKFIFEHYRFDDVTNTATFVYSFDNGRYFTETIVFDIHGTYDKSVLDKALRLAFLTAGVSYYKCFPTNNVAMATGEFSVAEAALLNVVYRDGLSQFMFENGLELADMPTFLPGDEQREHAVPYGGNGVLTLQSGGKDSLLLARFLKRGGVEFAAMHSSSNGAYPAVIDRIGAQRVRIMERHIDTAALRLATQDGGLNGHVPVTYITLIYALVDAILHNENTILTAIGHEGDEAHAWIGSMAMNHQWSKTWQAEQLLADHVKNEISPAIKIGSPLRGYYELRIAELFAAMAWGEYGHAFSSCNLANYKQGHVNAALAWCGECPKCANSFLLFAPFVPPTELASIFNGQNLFNKPQFTAMFKGLLGVDGAMKPLECVGEVAELRQAYHMARQNYPGAYELPFTVPAGDFDYKAVGECQSWASKYATA